MHRGAACLPAHETGERQRRWGVACPCRTTASHARAGRHRHGTGAAAAPSGKRQTVDRVMAPHRHEGAPLFCSIASLTVILKPDIVFSNVAGHTRRRRNALRVTARHQNGGQPQCPRALGAGDAMAPMPRARGRCAPGPPSPRLAPAKPRRPWRCNGRPRGRKPARWWCQARPGLRRPPAIVFTEKPSGRAAQVRGSVRIGVSPSMSRQSAARGMRRGGRAWHAQQGQHDAGQIAVSFVPPLSPAWNPARRCIRRVRGRREPGTGTVPRAKGHPSDAIAFSDIAFSNIRCMAATPASRPCPSPSTAPSTPPCGP